MNKIWIIYFIEMIILSIIKPLITDFYYVSLFATILHIMITIILLLSEKKQIRSVVVWAYIMRVITLFIDLFLRDTIILPSSGADTETYYRNSLVVAENLNLVGASDNISIYSEIMGMLIKLIGPMRIYLQYFNILLGLTIIFGIFRILTLLNIHRKTKKIILCIISFMPNAVILTSIFLREAFITFFVTLSLYFFVKWYLNNSKFNMILAIIMILFGSMFHSGVIGIGLGYIFSFLFFNHKSKQIIFTTKTISYSVLIVCLLALFMSTLGEAVLFKFNDLENSSDLFESTSGVGSGGSAYLQNLEITNLFEFLIYSPIKLLYFYFSPMIWDIRGLSDILTVIIDSSVYIGILSYILLTRRFLTKNRILIIMLLLIIIVTGIIFGNGVGNAGTAMRHRFKILPIFLIVLSILLDSVRNSKKQVFANRQGGTHGRL